MTIAGSSLRRRRHHLPGSRRSRSLSVLSRVYADRRLDATAARVLRLRADQNCMSVVLAVDPDRNQAEILRRLFPDETATKLVVVTSAYAAVVWMNRDAPDVLLLSDA